MRPADDEGIVLVTGASGHIGSAVCRVLKSGKRKILPVDINPDKRRDVVACDLRLKNDLSRLFQTREIRVVIHLAGILPSAFQADPLAGADVNLTGCFELMRQAANARVKRFVFASSMSVYGSSPSRHPLTEDDPTMPDEPYGIAKQVVELIGGTLAKRGAIEFVSLRIARVVGPGIKKTASPWRSQILEPLPRVDTIHIPFSPEAKLSLVHVEDVARMLVTLADTAEMFSFVYNTPVETCEARQLKEIVQELRGINVKLGPEFAHGGPMCDGSRFSREFKFQLRGLRDYLADSSKKNVDLRKNS
jgi:nucleoside-diphosphate-sugar epimerase